MEPNIPYWFASTLYYNILLLSGISSACILNVKFKTIPMMVFCHFAGLVYISLIATLSLLCLDQIHLPVLICMSFIPITIFIYKNNENNDFLKRLFYMLILGNLMHIFSDEIGQLTHVMQADSVHSYFAGFAISKHGVSMLKSYTADDPFLNPGAILCFIRWPFIVLNIAAAASCGLFTLPWLLPLLAMQIGLLIYWGISQICCQKKNTLFFSVLAAAAFGAAFFTPESKFLLANLRANMVSSCFTMAGLIFFVVGESKKKISYSNVGLILLGACISIRPSGVGMMLPLYMYCILTSETMASRNLMMNIFIVLVTIINIPVFQWMLFHGVKLNGNEASFSSLFYTFPVCVCGMLFALCFRFFRKWISHLALPVGLLIIFELAILFFLFAPHLWPVYKFLFLYVFDCKYMSYLGILLTASSVACLFLPDSHAAKRFGVLMLVAFISFLGFYFMVLSMTNPEWFYYTEKITTATKFSEFRGASIMRDYSTITQLLPVFIVFTICGYWEKAFTKKQDNLAICTGN